MKAEILKIAGVKDEKSFYKKYPSEEAFMKVHGKAFKKAQVGAMINKTETLSNPKPINFQNIYDNYDLSVTGMTDEMRQKQAAEQAAASKSSDKGGAPGGMDMGSIMKMFGGEEGGGAEGMAAAFGRYGINVPKAQVGYPVPFDSSLEGSPGFQQQGYNNVGSQTNDNFISISDEQLANKNGMYNGYSDPGGPNTGGKSAGSGLMDVVGKNAGVVGDVIGGIKALRGERRARKAAEQQKAVSDITLKASQTRPEQIQRKYVRPEDIQNTGEEFFPIYGVGTNVLARNGAMLQGGGEIQNTYAPDNLYDDLGYEPLDDSNVKQYYHGGRIHQMQDGGMTPDMYGQIGSTATNLGQSAMGGQNAGGRIGGTIGKTAGTAFGGPIGGAIGEFAGGMIGNALDTNGKRMKRAQEATRRNITAMALNSGFQGIQGQNQSYMKDGGYMNPEYNPQLITMFGDHNAQDFADYAHKFRAGGHLKSYTPPSERALQTYEDGGGIKSYGLGGELETHWGGGAETMSYNPYLPGSGETVMFRGKSHEEYSPNGETGIGVTYGGNPVEVERGEPMVELEEGGVVDPQTGEVQKSGVVFGNLKIPNQYIDMLGDKSAKGMKFKNYVANLSKTEAKQNKLVEKTTNELNTFTPLTSFDKLKMSALEANMMGANMKLKDIADKKINAASLQNAINDTAEENGLVADDLARGKIKIDKEAMKQQAKYGGSFSKAQDGKNLSKEDYDYLVDLYNQAEKQKKGPIVEKFQREFSRLAPEKAKSVLAQFPITNYGKSKGIKKDDVASNYDQIFGDRTKAYRASLREPEVDIMPLTPPRFSNQEIKTSPIINTKTTEEEEEPVNNNWMNILNAAIPYLRPTDQESLDMAQLYPEMYAMSSNQLEPVPAQGYQPELGVPYDISLQDQLNANQSDYIAAQRMTGYNPAAQANLNAQKYQANQQVLGNQFRANQEMKDRVYTQNRNILNDAKLKNLDIFDRQYGRQAQALSNTKATTQAALNSIADKYAKNKLENRTLGVYENLYNYRFDKNGRAINMNGFAQFDTDVAGATNRNSEKNAAPEGYEYETVLKKKKEKDARNGSIVKSYKNI